MLTLVAIAKQVRNFTSNMANGVFLYFFFYILEKFSNFNFQHISFLVLNLWLNMFWSETNFMIIVNSIKTKDVDDKQKVVYF